MVTLPVRPAPGCCVLAPAIRNGPEAHLDPILGPEIRRSRRRRRRELVRGIETSNPRQRRRRLYALWHEDKRCCFCREPTVLPEGDRPNGQSYQEPANMATLHHRWPTYDPRRVEQGNDWSLTLLACRDCNQWYGELFSTFYRQPGGFHVPRGIWTRDFETARARRLARREAAGLAPPSTAAVTVAVIEHPGDQVA